MQPQDYFTLFGVPKVYTQNLATLKTRFYQLQQKVHPDKFTSALISEKKAALALAAMINDAYQVLCTPLKRATYLLKCHRIDVDVETDTHMSMDFLMEQMSLRERLADNEGQTLKQEIETKLHNCENELSHLLGEEAPSQVALAKARDIVRQMQFFVRLHEEYEEQDYNVTTNTRT